MKLEKEAPSCMYGAWIIVAVERKPSPNDVSYGNVPLGTPIAVLPMETPVEAVRTAVDTLVQCLSLNRYPSDLIPYITEGRSAPYQARTAAWGQQVHGGFDPYVEAFRVDDLVVVTNQETGEERFDFTRNTPVKPQSMKPPREP